MSANTQNDASFTYFVSYLLRNTIPARRIGELSGRVSIGKWLLANKFNRVWSFMTSQLSKIDIKIDSLQQADVIVGHNPFKDADILQMESILQILDTSTVGCILAIPNSTHHEIVPAMVYSIKEWKKILSQLGNVVVINHNPCWSLFLVLK